MKITKPILALLTLTSGFASAASVVYSGNGLVNLQGSTAADLTAGKLGLLIADTGAGDFATTLTNIDTSLANLAAGSTFGGNLIVARISSSFSLSDGKLSGNFTWNEGVIPASTRWALVWFETLTAVGTDNQAGVGSKYGIASATDWVTPSVEPAAGVTVTYNTAPTGTQIRTISLNNGGSATALPTGALFATNGTSLAIVGIPEPSAAILGMIGGLALLRRRRN